MLLDHLHRGAPAKRAVVGEQLEDHNAQGVLVGRGRALSLDLFGRNVKRSPHHHAGAQVHQFDLALAGEKDIVGFDVAMDHVLFVEISQSRGQGSRQLSELPPANGGPAPHSLAQCLAFQQLAYHEEPPLFVFPPVVNFRQVGMG